MRIDGKQGAGIPKEDAIVKTVVSAQPVKKGKGRPSSTGGTSKYMQKKYGNASTTQVSNSTEPKTIHNVILLDRSSSMSSSGKYQAAMEGVSLSHRALGFETSANPNLNYVLSYVLFGSPGRYDWIFKGAVYNDSTREDIDWSSRSRATDGSTALYDAIYTIGEYLKTTAPKVDQVLISIFTDGEENSSNGPISGYRNGGWGKRDTTKVKAYIKELQDVYGYTLTFVGTEFDTQTAINDLGFTASNTASYDGTGKGMAETMMLNTQSRGLYSKAVLANEDVKSNFYSKSLKNEH